MSYQINSGLWVAGFPPTNTTVSPVPAPTTATHASTRKRAKTDVVAVVDPASGKVFHWPPKLAKVIIAVAAMMMVVIAVAFVFVTAWIGYVVSLIF